MGPWHLMASAGHGGDHLEDPAHAGPVRLDVFRSFQPLRGSLWLGPASPRWCTGHAFCPEPLG